MRKMGIITAEAPVTGEAKQAYEQVFAKPLTKEHLAAIRELFPAASALSDTELLTATMQVGELVAV